MTKEITKAFIIQQIEDKFKLRDFEPEKFLFSETVIPVYNIEPHLSAWEVKASTVNITSAEAYTFFTVPDTERWTLRSYQLLFQATGAIKASGLLVSHRPLTADSIYLDLKKGQEVSYLVNLPQLVVLQPGNLLRVLIDTYVSPQDLIVRIDVKREEIR